MASKRESLIASAEKSLLKGRVDAALKDYLKVLEETPADINVLNKVGDLYVRLGKNEDSIPFFLRIAEHYARDGFYVRGIAMYKKINKLDPARLDIYEKLAELYVKQQLWMEAKSNYQVLADYLLKQDNLQGAVGIYQKMVAIEPQNLQLHVRLADLFTQAKRIPEALQEYAVVAAALSERGAHEESIRVYEKALKLAPDNVEILKTLVPLLLSINSVEQARAVLRKGLEASPRSVPLFLLAADAAFAANDMAEARSYSDKARAVEPENEEVLAAAVRIQLKGRRPDLAWSAALPLAEASVRRGETRKALALLVPIARAAPDNEDIVKKIVDLAAGSGDETTALPFRSALAELYRKKGMVAEAADLLRTCSRTQPDNAEFRARLTQLEALAGIVSVAPPRVPPPSLERNLEVTASGFGLPERKEPKPEPAPPVPPEPAEAEPLAAAQEFEFDLDDSELAGADAPAAAAPPTPPRGLPAPPYVPVPAADVLDDGGPAWGTVSAAEALEAFEAREAAAARARSEEIDELHPGAALPAATPATGVPSAPRGSAAPFAAPEGFGPVAGHDEPEFPPPSFGEAGGPPSWGPVSGAISPEAAIEDALVEADVFRRYGLLEKALEQLLPWVEKAPGNLKVRERMFEISLEQGNRDVARAHGLVLAEAYEASGREDRIRGLEGLLGEPLRAAAEAPAVVVEAPADAVVPAMAESFPIAAGLGEALPEGFDSLEASRDAAVEPPLPTPEPIGFDASHEPLTEILESPAARPMPAEQEPGLSEDLGFLPAAAEALPPLEPVSLPEAPVESASPSGEIAAPIPVPSPAEIEAAPVQAEPPAPQVEPEPAREDSLYQAVEPEPTPVEPGLAASPLPAAPPATPRPRLSAEDLLGLGKPAREATSKKVRAVRPEDVELELLGGKPKGKPKAPKGSRPDVELPADLLQGLRKPHAVAAPAAAAVPAPSLAPPTAAASEPSEMPRAEVEGLSAAPPFEGPAAVAGEPPIPAGLGEAVAFEAPPRDEPGIPEPRFEEPLPAEAPLAVEETTLPDLVATLEGPGVFAATALRPTEEELSELDFCLDQGMVVDAAERLQSLEGRFPADPELATRRLRLEGGRGTGDASRAALHDLLSDDLDSVLDAELGRALTEDMVRESHAASGPIPVVPQGAPVVDDSGLFSDEQEFFNFADELHTELRKEGESAPPEEGREVSLEEIFRDFKKGVEQQLSPEDYETHYNLGIAYKEMGLTDEAIGEFQLAAKDPLHAVECCAMLGLCFLEKGLPQLAVKWYRKGLDTIGIKDDDRLGLQYALAGVLEQIGDNEGAYRTYLEIFSANASYRDVPARIKELRPIVAP